MSLILSMARTFRRISLFPSDETARKFVFRTGDVNAGANGWAGRIVEMGDGRSVSEIVSAIYLEELQAGAWAADIGLWSQFFAIRVIEVIDQLTAQGLIRVELER